MCNALNTHSHTTAIAETNVEQKQLATIKQYILLNVQTFQSAFTVDHIFTYGANKCEKCGFY